MDFLFHTEVSCSFILTKDTDTVSLFQSKNRPVLGRFHYWLNTNQVTKLRLALHRPPKKLFGLQIISS
jgi:hypothetical protein